MTEKMNRDPRESGIRCFRFRIAALLAVVVILFAGLSSGAVIKKAVHKDKTKLPGGCSSCHKGHGKKNTVMLPLPENEFCFSCHGMAEKQQKVLKEKKMAANVVLKNIEDDFRKVFHHPVEIVGVHAADEKLPETDSGLARHATCMDCHNAHLVARDFPFEGVKGSKKKVKITDNVREFEICYKCHSYSANLPPTQKNKELEFDPRNRSYHPVEEIGRNVNVPSLIQPWTPTSMMTCSDCHGSDSFNPPKGPHGSNNEHILKKRYVELVRAQENPQNYELCYTCHRRENLLANASWKEHGRHISITSCKTCHNSHGSRDNPYLIDFNKMAVFPNKEGRLDFMEQGSGKFDCLLKCHDADHSTGKVTLNQPAAPAAVKGRKK